MAGNPGRATPQGPFAGDAAAATATTTESMTPTKREPPASPLLLGVLPQRSAMGSRLSTRREDMIGQTSDMCSFCSFQSVRGDSIWLLSFKEEEEAGLCPNSLDKRFSQKEGCSDAKDDKSPLYHFTWLSDTLSSSHAHASEIRLPPDITQPCLVTRQWFIPSLGGKRGNAKLLYQLLILLPALKPGYLQVSLPLAWSWLSLF